MTLTRFSIPTTRTAICRALFILGVVLYISPVTAFAAGEISQGYTIDGNTTIAAGALMSVKSATLNSVSLATSDTSNQLLGIAGKASIIQIGSSKQAQVITSGLTNGLVSDINGTVKVGDKITASPLSGIGMKATDTGEIVGTAQSNLSSMNTTSQTITDKTGKKTTVHVASIPIQVNVSYYVAKEDHLQAIIPPFLLTFSAAIAGHEVSPLRVLGSVFALLLGFITVAIMLQSAVRSGIIAIGRNPLAQRALRKGMVEVGLTAVGVLALTIVVTYILIIA